MTDPVGKPFWENYSNKNNSLNDIEHAKFLSQRINDIELILKLRCINATDMLKLIHEISEQALNVKAGDLNTTIFLCIHNWSQTDQ